MSIHSSRVVSVGLTKKTTVVTLMVKRQMWLFCVLLVIFQTIMEV